MKRAKAKHDWPLRRLGDVARYINGAAFKPSDWTLDGLPIIRIQNLTDPDAPCNRYAGNLDDKFRVRDGDLLVSWSATLDVFRWQRGPAWLNQHIFRVEENPSLVSRDYLTFAIKRSLAKLQAQAHGTTMLHIKRGPFEDTTIPIPPLVEQQRLVNRIESLKSRLEQARQIRIDVLADMRAALAATLASIFEGDEDWIETTLDEVCTMKTGKTPPTKQSEYFGGDVPFVCPADVGSSLRIMQAERTLSRLAITDRKANLFPCGTVLLVGIGSTVGKVGIAAADVCTNQQITGLTFSARVDPEYAAWFLLSQRKEIVHAAADNGVPIINQNGIGKLTIRFPEDVNDQRRIVERLDALAEKQAELRRLQAETEAELAAFTPSLLAKAFRGEL